jgi:uncharacterized membrane protein
MPELVPWLLFVHVLTAIVAFGPTFAFPIIGAMGGKEPQYANFATRVSEAIAHRMVLPLALTMPISGLLLIWSARIDLLNVRWLLLGIAIYAFIIGYVILVQNPAVSRIVQLSSQTPPPLPELGATVKKVQQGGMLLTVLIVAIVLLMVAKPI